MVKTRQKMQRSNSKIKKYLISNGFLFLYSFPHQRFMKDYNFEGEPFDAMGWKMNRGILYLFQYKSNSRPSRDTLKRYTEIERKYYVKLIWINCVDRKGLEIFDKNGLIGDLE